MRVITAGTTRQLAERVKKSGYPADIRRMDSPTAPWAVRVGTYSTRDQAESGLPGRAGLGQTQA